MYSDGGLEGNARIRVLLVDGNTDFANAAADFLQRHEDLAVVGAFSESSEALAAAQDLQPHVVLMGLDRPGPTGLECIPRLRAKLPGVCIIALTLSDGSAYQRAALAAGADELVCKANLTTDLLPAIRRVTEAGCLPSLPSSAPG